VGPWWLYLLVFLFGHLTCRTFYFFRASRISLSLITYSQIIYLSCMRSAVERLSEIKQDAVDEHNETHDELQQKIDEQISILKNNSINYLINMHPKFYRESLAFDDWESSLNFLEEKKEEAFNFWKHNHD
jgi:hypothetical protein